MALLLFSVFIIMYLMEFGFETVLVLLNARYALDQKHEIPELVGKFLDQEKYNKTNLYTISKSKFAIVTSFISALILLLVLFSGLFNDFDLYLRSHLTSDIWRGVVYILLLGFVATFIGLPASIYHTFVLESKYGFNKTTPALFVMDLLKGFVLNGLILTPILYMIFLFVEKAGSFWWFFAATGLFLIQLLLAYLYPVLIAPLFNKFTPLEDEELNNKIGEVAKKVEFPFKEIQVMDGSKRSKHSNAYFTGFGKNKRIVLFDTLLEKLSHDEIVAVLAHEIGHFKHKHILKRMVVSALMMFLIFFLLDQVLKNPPFFQAFLIDTPSAYLGFILFGLYFSTVSFWATPFFSMWSRKNEFEADAFAVNHVENGTALKEALIKLNVENLSNLYPHPGYVFFHYSHPPLLERLEQIK